MADWPVAQDAALYTPATLAGASSYGINVTAGTPAHNKGSWAEVHAALPFDCDGIYTSVPGTNSAAEYAVDIGIGANGSEQVLIANWAYASVRFSGQSIFWPVHIAKGTRVAIRSQCGLASTASQVAMMFMSSGFAHAPSYSFCETYNFNAANTASTTGNYDPGGTANTKAAYITVGTTTRQIRALNIMLDIRNAAATTYNWRCDIAVGATPDILIPDIALLAEVTADELAQRAFGPFPINIPSGTAIKFRAQCSGTDATDRIIRNIHMYGFG